MDEQRLTQRVDFAKVPPGGNNQRRHNGSDTMARSIGNGTTGQVPVRLFPRAGTWGQKRNKTSNSVRLTHLPTGFHVLAGESRSLQENKIRAVRRLKLKLAVSVRQPIDPRFFEPPAWFGQVVQVGRLAVSHHNDHYARTAALVLDLLDRRGSVGDVAKLLGVTTSSILKF